MVEVLRTFGLLGFCDLLSHSLFAIRSKVVDNCSDIGMYRRSDKAEKCRTMIIVCVVAATSDNEVSLKYSQYVGRDVVRSGCRRNGRQIGTLACH